MNKATSIWYDEWVKQGKHDRGTCCGGKCIRDRKTNRVLADSPPVQGNMSAYDTHKPALAYLNSIGFDAYYDDGWMDQLITNALGAFAPFAFTKNIGKFYYDY